MIEFAYQKFELEVQHETKLAQGKEESKRQRSLSGSIDSGVDDDDSDFSDDSSMYEKKLNILLIPHVILWKIINERHLSLEDMSLTGPDALAFIL